MDQAKEESAVTQRMFIKKPWTKKTLSAGKELCVLLAVILVCAAALWALERPEEAAQTAAVSRTLLSDSARIQSIGIAQGDDVFTLLAAASGGYLVDEDRELALNTDLTASVFSALSSLSLEPLEAAGGLSLYGLSPAAGALNIRAGEESVSLELGNLSPSATSRYVLLDGQLYTAPLFLNGIPSIRSLHAVPSLYSNGEMPVSFTLSRPDGTRVSGGITDGRTVGVTSLVVTEPFQWEMDIEKAASLINSIGAIDIQAWEMKNTPENRSACGLDKPLSFTALYHPEGSDPFGWTLHLGAAANGNLRYMYLEGDGNIFSVSAESVRFLDDLDATALMNRFAGLVALQLIEQADVSWESHAISLRQKLAETGNAYYINGKTMDESSFKALYQQLIAPRVDGLLPEDAQAGEARLSILYKLSDGTEESVVYRTWNQDYDALERNGELLFYISREKVDATISALNKLFQ